MANLFSLEEREYAKIYINFLQTRESELFIDNKIVKTQKKVFFCEFGRIEYSFRYTKGIDGKLYSPLRQYLRLNKYESMSQDFKNKLIMKASRTTYQKAVEDINDSFGFSISKKTLNRYVIAGCNKIEVVQTPSQEQNILIGDSTKVRKVHGGHHEVFGAISLDYNTNISSLTAFEVNVPAKEIAPKIDLANYQAFVGDGDLGLRNFFKDKLPFQLCHHHAITDISFFLWKEGMNKKDRDIINLKLKSILYTLQNSTKKFRRTNKTGRLVNRIIRSRKAILNLATEISLKGYFQASRYLVDHVDHLLTAAKLALVGIKCPWTTNHAERLMQEIGVRTKKKGMNWTENGLKAILSIVLKRYFIKSNQRSYKEVFNYSKEVVEAHNQL